MLTAFAVIAALIIGGAMGAFVAYVIIARAIGIAIMRGIGGG